MDWIHVDEEIFDYAGQRTNEADTALYGRVTYQMMESYWPTAAEQPNATKHDIDHSTWYNGVQKIVLSHTMKEAAKPNTRIISENVADEILQLKKTPGRDIIIFGSPTASHFLMRENLIDDYWLLINPILLGSGIPMFAQIPERLHIRLVNSNVFSSGVVCVHYSRS